MLELKNVKIIYEEKDESFLCKVLKFLEDAKMQTVVDWNICRADLFNKYSTEKEQRLLTALLDCSGIIKKFKLKKSVL